jgi:hypothetical protein
VAQISSGTLIINGGSFEHGIGITIQSYTGAGVYPLSTTAPLRGIVATSGTASWGLGSGASGTIEIVSASATRVTGTFTGTLDPISGTSSQVEVTDGSFTVGLP